MLTLEKSSKISINQDKHNAFVYFLDFLTTNVPVNHIETSQSRANQLTGFYMMGTLVVKRLMQHALSVISIITL